jgi:putrescine transport system substrate-binding protein
MLKDWSNYIAPETIANFEKETGIKVRCDNFGSNEILHAKLVAGKTGCDTVVRSSYWARMQADGGLPQKVDKGHCPIEKLRSRLPGSACAPGSG